VTWQFFFIFATISKIENFYPGIGLPSSRGWRLPPGG